VGDVVSLAAGRLRDRIDLQADAETPNGQGGNSSSWATFASAWAEVIGLSGSEARKAGIERNVRQWRITMRPRTDLTEAHRIRWKGLVMNIKAIVPDPDDPRAAIVLNCESGGIDP
jgi:SPP1 family predicted phage head-tail adaptor